MRLFDQYRAHRQGLFLGCVFAFVMLFLPSVVGAEYIDSFQSDIVLHKDSSFTVTETIAYVFTEDRHGIFRYIPRIHPQESSTWYRNRYLDITVHSVTMDDSHVFYEVEDNDELYLKIGDPNQKISGTHVYEITYDVKGGLLYLPYGGAELYWNVTGTDWEVPMRIVRATVRGDGGYFTRERACYKGSADTSGSCDGITEENGLITVIGRDLGPGIGLTVARGVDRTKVDEIVLEKTNYVWFFLVGGVLWLFALAYYVYAYKTAYKTDNPIIAEYEPYQDLKPMYVGLLYDGTLNPQDLTACIVYLAGEGYLKVRKLEKKVSFFFEADDYEITLIKLPDESISDFQRSVLQLLFGEALEEGNKVSLDDLRKNHSKQLENQKILRELKKKLEKDLVASGFYQIYLSPYLIPGAVIFVGLILFSALAAFGEGFEYVGIALAIFGFSLGILAFMYQRRTQKGYEALDHIEGFKLFLSVTDEDRFAFHNAPEKNPEQFMKFLPYAIALDVEKQWAKVFEGITIPNPEWYDGGSSTHAFSATNLSSSLGAFSAAFASSSGSSGSSGGGSVGSGGGGGGGGSW